MADQTQEFQVMMLLVQAMGAVRFGDYEEAINLLTQALQLAPHRGDIYHNRGVAYSKLQRWYEALADFDRAIALDPHPTSYEQRGRVHYQLGNRKAARRDYEQAIRLDARRSLALCNLGWLCIEDRDFRKAVDYLTRAINAEPTYAKAYENRARAYFEMGNIAQARADLAKARELVESGEDMPNRERFE